MTISSEGSAVNTLERLLREAIERLASDMHFETEADHFRVRLRIDGQLRIIATPELKLRDAIISRIKVLARMDIAEKRIPQDGRIRYLHANELIDLRVSSLPTLHGEKVVIRILNFNKIRPSLETLGYEPDDCIKLIEAIHRPHGLILMTGPTGSGKTSSLYSCLELLNRPEINISTVEDPSEIHLKGVNQVTVNERAGLTFASTMRALLRQDPDVIMIGEIRDTETAEIAIQASQTGHLVLSTLHTNDAPSSLVRLQHMGIAAFNVAASMSLVTAQLLIRRLCDDCKRPLPTDIAKHQLKQFSSCMSLHSKHIAQKSFYQPVGCPLCTNGYKGRAGIYQVMPISEAMQILVMQQSDLRALSTQASNEGMRTLRQAGYIKATQGLTSLEEVLALTQHD
jgi:type IV pilus assembly protein PilB